MKIQNGCLFGSLKRIVLLVILGTISGCGTVGYYAQAVGGHLSLMSKRQPLEKVMAAEDTDPEIKRKLELLRDARVFAVDTLSLPRMTAIAPSLKPEKRT